MASSRTKEELCVMNAMQRYVGTPMPCSYVCSSATVFLSQVKAAGMGKYMCQKCHSVVDEEPLRFRGEVYHPYHFNCTGCGQELTSSAREVRTRPGYTAQVWWIGAL